MTPALRLAAGGLAVIFGALAADKLLDLDGYAAALATSPLVAPDTAWEAATLLAALEACAAALLVLVAFAGRHARVAFEGGAALALAASLAYAILIVSAFYAEHPIDAGGLFGTRLAPRVPTAALVAFVLLLLSWSAWLLTNAFLLPNVPPRRRRRLPPTRALRRVG